MKNKIYLLFLNRMKWWTRSGVLEFLDEHLKNDNSDSILVIGGKGPVLDHILKLNLKAKITTLDINSEHNPDITIDIADELVSKEIIGRFDKIIALEVLEHVSNYGEALENINLLINEKGKFLASTPWITPLHDTPNDFHRFTWFEIKKMLEKAQFKNIKIESRGNYFDSIIALCVRGFMMDGIFYKLIGVIFILFSTILPKPRRFSNTKESCIGYNFSASL